MTTITLNADVLRLIIREAALEAERSSSSSPIDAFNQRSAALRRMSLVNPQWRYLAQLELQSFLVLTTRNFSSISKALEQNGMAKRVRTLVDRRGLTREQKPLGEMLEKCEGLRELDCQNSRFSLHSLKRMQNLHTISFSNCTLSGDVKNLKLPFRLRSFSLTGASTIRKEDWKTLSSTGIRSIEHLELSGRQTSNPSFLLDTLSCWLPTIRTLEIADILISTPFIPSLHLCRQLERLSIKLSDFPSSLAILGCSPRHLEIVAPSEVLDDWTFIDYQTNVLYAVGREPLDQLETVKVSRAPGIQDSLGSRETALLVKIGRRKAKAAGLSHGMVTR